MKISKADARTWFEFFSSLPEYEELSPRQEEIVWAALRQIEEAVEAEQRCLWARRRGFRRAAARV